MIRCWITSCDALGTRWRMTLLLFFWSGLIMKYCLMKCPDVITTVDLMADLLCEIDDIEKLSQTFILLQQVFATEGQQKSRRWLWLFMANGLSLACNVFRGNSHQCRQRMPNPPLGVRQRCVELRGCMKSLLDMGMRGVYRCGEAAVTSSPRERTPIGFDKRMR